MKPSLSFAERLGRIDVRVIHFLVALLILLPLIRPVGLPTQISEGTQKAYDTFDALPPGSTILIDYSIGAACAPELEPQATAWMHHLMAKRTKIVLTFVYSAEGPIFAQKMLDTVAKEYNYEYGKEIVMTPYRAGQETALAAIARDFQGVFPQDYYGADSSTLPLMQEIQDINDFALVAHLANFGPDIYVRQIGAPYGVPIVCGTTGVCSPLAQAYFASGQIQGLVAALGGAAEYEVLVGKPGPAAAMMDAQSSTHLFAVILVVLCNISYFLTRKSGQAGQGR